MRPETNDMIRGEAGGHISANVMIDVFYGIAEDSSLAAMREHLAECSLCSERWNELAGRRSASVQPVEVSPEFLAAQRRRIYERMERVGSGRWKIWVPAAAIAAALTAAVFTFRPMPENNAMESRVETQFEVNDSQLFSEVYTLEQSYEPSAVASMQALFVEDTDRHDAAEENN